MENISENTDLIIFDSLFCSEYFWVKTYIEYDIDRKISTY